MPSSVRDFLLGIDWSGRTCNTVNDRTQSVYAKAKRLVLQWEADAADAPREKEAAAWLVQASDALLCTNDLDRRQREPIGARIGFFLDGEWERVDDFSREAEAMLVAGADAPSTPTQHGVPLPLSTPPWKGGTAGRSSCAAWEVR